MAYRISRAIGVALFLTLLLTLPALAGGWAVITLDEWPGEVDPTQPLKIGFVVRQHGVRPMEGLEPTITFRSPDTGERFTVQAKPEGETGHYTAVFSFPSTGTWNWSIQAFSMDQPMPPLSVSVTVPSATGSERLSPVPFQLLGVLGLTLASAGLILVFRQPKRWGAVLIAVGLLAGLTGLVSAMDLPARAEGKAASPSAFSAQQQLGQDLFIAKGCVTCHINGRVKTEGHTLIGIGVDLTSYQADPEYLMSWLKDPSSIKPDTKMPDLGLKKDEIEALIAFINARSGK